jgi:NitT/TauT family transport system ATP-binding protein
MARLTLLESGESEFQPIGETGTEPYAIDYRAVTKRFPDRRGKGTMTAVSEVSLSIRTGEVVALIGPSGCGKSTLLNMGAGLSAPSEGEVRVAGNTILAPTKDVAFMLQKDLLMPWRSIQKNVELGMQVQGISATERRERAARMLERCQLKGFGSHYPHQLSGGMRQRAALARTLAMEPQVLLMDEPFSALDAQTKMILQQDLASMLFEQRKTALLITHDLSEAIALSDRVYVMSERPGKIIKQIPIEMPLRENPLERRKLSRMNDYVAQLMDLLHVGSKHDLD